MDDSQSTATGPIKKDPLGNINATLTSIGNSTLDVEKLFGPEVKNASLDKDGTVNYMKLYDCLSSNEQDLLKLERVLDSFNRFRQHSIETKSAQAAKAQLALNAESHVSMAHYQLSQGTTNRTLTRIISEWQQTLALVFKKLFREIEDMDGKRSRRGKLSTSIPVFSRKLFEYRDMLFKLGPEGLAMTVAMEMAALCLESTTRMNPTVPTSGYSLLTSHVATRLGKLVEQAYVATLCEEQEQAWQEKYGSKENASWLGKTHFLGRSTSRMSLTSEVSRVYWDKAGVKKMSVHDDAELGVRLLTIFMENCVYLPPNPDAQSSQQEPEPAFTHGYEVYQSKLTGVIKPHSRLLLAVSDASVGYGELMLSKTVPMLVKPRPWTSSTDGGYWYTKQPLITTRPNSAPEQHAYLDAAIAGQYMDDFLLCLDNVAQCAWAVNTSVLDVIMEIWNKGETFLDIPGLVDGQDPHETVKILGKAKKMGPEFNQATLRISLDYILKIAQVYARHGERFYFPYMIDYRGRLYPLSNSGFWHLGTDHVRALFQFWYGKPLGLNGLWWLKIQLANTYGVDKVSNEARVQFVNEHWDDIVDSADQPLKGKKWWTKGEDPFQVLAACFEVVAAVRSGNPELYVSRLPVSQDGSCNGLQHYAALGRDYEGAVEVNLTRQQGLSSKEGPQDVYSKVMKLVVAGIERDAAMTPSDPKYDEKTVLLAQDLRGKITRKIVKQPVMTNVYGVTNYGIFRQVVSKLETGAVGGLDKAKTAQYGLYIGAQISAAIRTLFKRAKEIQDWLRECSDRICESVRFDSCGDVHVVSHQDFLTKCVTSVKWTTPLGLPVVQPYRKQALMIFRAGLQTLALRNPYEMNFVNKIKQRNGIAPNFIHSLDSTHMLMTAHACVAKERVQFAAVHDSFWTHASSVDTMNRVLREQFVDLHKKNHVAALRREFEQRYDGFLQCVYVARQSEAGQEIEKLRETYFVEGGEEETLPEILGTAKRRQVVLRHEMGREYNKWQLLQSSEESDWAKAHSIITPSSIIEKYQEPTVWRLDTRGTKYQPYSHEFVQPDADSEVPSSLDDLKALESSEQDENALETDEPSTSSSSQRMNYKWIKVLVPIKFPVVPGRGELDIKEVLHSEYFFS